MVDNQVENQVVECAVCHRKLQISEAKALGSVIYGRLKVLYFCSTSHAMQYLYDTAFQFTEDQQVHELCARIENGR